MAGAQDWCLECGAGAPGLFAARPGWRSATGIIAATVILVAVAVAASYAALSTSSKRVVTRPATVAQTPPPASPAPPASTPAPTPPAAAKPGPTLPAVTPGKTAKTPPIAAHTPTPAPAPAPPPAPAPQPASPAPAASTPAPVTHSTAPAHPKSTISPNSAAGALGSKVVLDPDAASTYNPYGYPDARFGDPSLAIDQDPSTSWTAQVEPSTAPRNADGLLIDLKAPQTLHRLRLRTSTSGMEFEVYGANGPQPPPSITDPAWHHLSPPHRASRDMLLKLLTGKQTYRYLAIWITKAASSSPTAKVAISELTLYH